MKCPYSDFDCTEVDTSGMDKIDCQDCIHYPENPETDEINELNKFMMGL